MVNPDLPSPSDHERALRERLWWLIGGRLVAVIVLAVAGTFWRGSAGAATLTFANLTLIIFVAVVMASIVYGLLLRFNTNLRRQAALQLGVDIALITGIIWASGDVYSPFVILYIINIAMASILVGPRAAIIASVACAVAFTSVAMPAALGMLPRAGDAVPVPSVIKAIQAVGLNDAAFLIVGLLVGQLAARQSKSDVELIATTQTLATLRALHERIVESIRSGLVTTDLEGRIYTFNAAAEEITGYRAETMKGENASRLFGDLSMAVEESLRASMEGEMAPRFETDVLTPEQLRLRIGYGIAPLFAESGETTGLVVTFQDLTDVRAMEETSRRQDRLAAVGRVAAGIAHEIRNPLAAMRGAIQVLQGDLKNSPAEAQLMEIILRESDRLNKIITDFLTYARPRLGEFNPVDVREVLQETFTLMRHSPELHADHVLEDVVPETPLLISADPAQLKQVFWNLARNALQSMPNGGRLRVEMRRRKNGRVHIEFTDNGCGMTPQQVERLFEPFSSSRTGGTGLGLSIVYQIIRDHSGTINVRSIEGQGTAINIELPGKESDPRSQKEL
jgi:two-component system sensor histidine kinase PilS (NtrC family)